MLTPVHAIRSVNWLLSLLSCVLSGLLLIRTNLGTLQSTFTALPRVEDTSISTLSCWDRANYPLQATERYRLDRLDIDG